MSNVSMDGETFLNLLQQQRAVIPPQANPLRVGPQPASPEEEEVLRRMTRNRNAGVPISAPDARARMVPGLAQSIMVHDSRNRFQRAVPMAVPRQHQQQDEGEGYQPLVPFRQDPPAVAPALRRYQSLDRMGHPMELGDYDEDDLDDDGMEDVPGLDEGLYRQQVVPTGVGGGGGGPGLIERLAATGYFGSNLEAARAADRQAQDNNVVSGGAVAQAAQTVVTPLRPMTRREQRGRVRRRQDEHAQQRAITEMVGDRETKQVLAKKREEPPDMRAMCTTAKMNTCTICMENHITTMVLPCRHTLFCNRCITEWVDAHGTCTACRADVTTTVQMITNFDVIEENKRRKVDPADSEERKNAAKAHRKEVADALRKEADNLEAGRETE
jgi:hypothetical protein